MKVLLNKFSKYLLIIYSVLRTMIGNIDITETADVLGEKDELGRYLGKMMLVSETVSKQYPSDEEDRTSEKGAQPVFRIPSYLFSSLVPCSLCLSLHFLQLYSMSGTKISASG